MDDDLDLTHEALLQLERLSQNYSLAEIAKALGVDRTNLHKWKVGKRPIPRERQEDILDGDLWAILKEAREDKEAEKLAETDVPEEVWGCFQKLLSLRPAHHLAVHMEARYADVIAWRAGESKIPRKFWDFLLKEVAKIEEMRRQLREKQLERENESEEVRAERHRRYRLKAQELLERERQWEIAEWHRQQAVAEKQRQALAEMYPQAAADYDREEREARAFREAFAPRERELLEIAATRKRARETG